MTTVSSGVSRRSGVSQICRSLKSTGDDSWVLETTLIYHADRCEIGERSRIIGNTVIYAEGGVSIGSDVWIERTARSLASPTRPAQTSGEPDGFCWRLYASTTGPGWERDGSSFPVEVSLGTRAAWRFAGFRDLEVGRRSGSTWIATQERTCGHFPWKPRGPAKKGLRLGTPSPAKESLSVTRQPGTGSPRLRPAGEQRWEDEVSVPCGWESGRPTGVEGSHAEMGAGRSLGRTAFSSRLHRLAVP